MPNEILLHKSAFIFLKKLILFATLSDIIMYYEREGFKCLKLTYFAAK